jgi:hypothetical protein
VVAAEVPALARSAEIFASLMALDPDVLRAHAGCTNVPANISSTKNTRDICAIVIIQVSGSS